MRDGWQAQRERGSEGQWEAGWEGWLEMSPLTGSNAAQPLSPLRAS